MAKQKFKITNWPTYNKALINRGSITFWLDDEAIQAWYESATPSSRGRPQRYSDLAITTVLVIKRVFRLTLRAAQGFIDSIFSLMNVPLRCPDYSCVSRRAKSVNISFKTPTRGEIAHLVIDSTGLKVFGIIMAVALALGIGTMIGWRRVAMTIGEKIGKRGMTYAQGMAAQMTAAVSIGLASYIGMPVSTTHVLSSAVAGTMVVDGGGLQRKTVTSILMAWVFTLPAAIFLSGGLYWIALQLI